MTNNTSADKPWYTRWWVILIGALIVVGVIGNALGLGSQNETAPTTERHTPNTTTSAPPPEKTPETNTAAEAEANILAGAGVENFQQLEATSPGAAITSIENVSPGTVRVYYQEHLTDADRTTLARWVYNMAQLEDLGTIVIQDASGIDTNHRPPNF